MSDDGGDTAAAAALVARARGFGFKRVGVKSLWVFLLLIPFALGGCGSAIGLIDEWQAERVVKAHRAKSEHAKESGPIRRVGVITRETPTTSPLGVKAAAWVGAIGYMRKYKSSVSFDPLCVRGDLTGLTLNDPATDSSGMKLDPATIRFSTQTTAVSFEPSHQFHMRSVYGWPMVAIGDLAHGSDEVPEKMTALCGSPQLRAPGGQALIYREDILADGAHVELLACAEDDGKVIVPCHDGVDIFTTRSVTSRFDSARKELFYLLLCSSLANVLVVTAFVLMLRRRLVRSGTTAAS